jgi:hypothetical protein
VASYLHKSGTSGTCADVSRCLAQMKLEKHFQSERLRAELWVEASKLSDEVRAPFLQLLASCCAVPTYNNGGAHAHTEEGRSLT